MGHASTLLGSAALEEVAELGLGIAAHRHAAFTVRDRDGELITLALVAAALLNEGAWLAWIFSVVPSENLHRSTPWKDESRVASSNHLALLAVQHLYSFDIAVRKAGRSTLDMISFIGDSTKKAFPVDTAMRSSVGTRYTFWPPLPESITVSTRR
jgi:hypothetical protein